MRYVTIIDIANELGISKSTVSRALSQTDHSVKRETRELIVETARRMGYHRNDMAVNLRKQHTKIIGISIPDASTPFFMTFTHFAQMELKKRGYHTIVVEAAEDYTTEREYLHMLVQSRVDGILVSACHKDKNLDLYRDIIGMGIPIVFFDRTVDGIDTSIVKMDDIIMSQFMVENMIRGGRRKIACLSGPDYIIPATERSIGYKDAVRKFRLDVDDRYIVDAGLSVDDGAAAMERFLDTGTEFDALFCWTETVMLGAKGVLQKRGYCIPKDVAIAASSGTLLCKSVHPAISAVEQSLEEMALNASRLLVNQIEFPTAPYEHLALRGQIVMRESTD